MHVGKQYKLASISLLIFVECWAWHLGAASAYFAAYIICSYPSKVNTYCSTSGTELIQELVVIVTALTALSVVVINGPIDDHLSISSEIFKASCM